MSFTGFSYLHVISLRIRCKLFYLSYHLSSFSNCGSGRMFMASHCGKNTSYNAKAVKKGDNSINKTLCLIIRNPKFVWHKVRNKKICRIRLELSTEYKRVELVYYLFRVRYLCQLLLCCIFFWLFKVKSSDGYAM